MNPLKSLSPRRQSPEARFIGTFRDQIPNSRLTRVESRVGLGVPDAIVTLSSGRIVLIEFKVVPPAGNKVRLSPHQISYMMRHAVLGAPMFIMVLRDRKPGARGGVLYIYGAGQAMDLFQKGLTVPPLLSHRVDMPGNWKIVEQFLMNWQRPDVLPTWSPPLKHSEIAAAELRTDVDYDPDEEILRDPYLPPLDVPAADPEYLRLRREGDNPK